MTDRVLFVDDEPEVTRSMSRALREEPYEIITANSADEAFGLLKVEKVSVVVSDEKMPGMSGSEFLAQVRKEYPDTVRLLFTGHASLEIATRAMNAGDVFRFLKKPCSEIDVAVSVRQALQYRRLFVKCHELIKTARALRIHLGESGLDAEKTKEAVSTLKDSVLGDTVELNVQHLIEALEQELSYFSSKPG